ncbi:mitochondrial glycerol-3-phosphate dehydrogenase [Perkinsus chesapeaki]|uniref:glycerol-3-phosphate dehydrogenase n=1 Tax=Perkinsus chesapeaki TaxID=330153 RepID=A0A7J6MD84_PERCH|nr:mitochondrial glycerol-3-phosphate dehydrogenase [Perkinsus chesapeaki]
MPGLASRVLLKTLKYGAVAGGTAIGGSCAYIYFNTPNAIPASAYRKTIPQFDRAKSLDKLRQEKFDVIVVGGGATGSSIALDGASRGLKVALLEAEDFGSGTSSRSTKLLHGGIGYLKGAMMGMDGQLFKMIYQSVRERSHMLHAAPYLTRPMPILLPAFYPMEALQRWIGVKLFDGMAKVMSLFDTGVPNSFWVSKSNTRFMFPLLKSEGLLGSMLYYDGQLNDSRMNLAIAMTSTVDDYIEGWVPATVANHAAVTHVLKDEQGRCNAVEVKDSLTGDKFQVSGKVIVNATGVRADALRRDANPDAEPKITVNAGAHMILPRSYAPRPYGMMIPATKNNNALFYFPWEGNTLIGTVNHSADLLDLPPHPTRESLDVIIDESTEYLSLNREDITEDITAAWSGTRQLSSDPNDPRFGKDFRGHQIVVDSSSGLISIFGGNWTTCRLMAEDCVDRVLAEHQGDVVAKYPCRTYKLRLIGSQDPRFPSWHADSSLRVKKMAMELHREYGVDIDDSTHLATTYGALAPTVCDFGKKTNSLSPLLPNQSYLRTEVLVACDQEMAESVTDVIANRTRMAFTDPVGTLAILPNIVQVVGDRKGWDLARREAEDRKARMLLSRMTYGSKTASNGGAAKMKRRRTYRDVPKVDESVESTN